MNKLNVYKGFIDIVITYNIYIDLDHNINIDHNRSTDIMTE